MIETYYRALGLLNHAYKVFSMVLIMRIVPYVEPKTSDIDFEKREAVNVNLLNLVNGNLSPDRKGREIRTKLLHYYIHRFCCSIRLYTY